MPLREALMLTFADFVDDLYDNHVAELLDRALYHVEHLRMGVRDSPAAVPEPAIAD